MPPYPRGGRKEKFAQPKSGKLALQWSFAALVVFMIGRWLNRLPFIDCSNSAAFFTAEQIFLKAWKARAFSSTPIFFEEPAFWGTQKFGCAKGFGHLQRFVAENGFCEINRN